MGCHKRMAVTHLDVVVQHLSVEQRADDVAGRGSVDVSEAQEPTPACVYGDSHAT